MECLEFGPAPAATRGRGGFTELVSTDFFAVAEGELIAVCGLRTVPSAGLAVADWGGARIADWGSGAPVVLMVVAGGGGGVRVEWDGGEVEAGIGGTVLLPAASVAGVRVVAVGEAARVLVVRVGS
jgi:hypothetical protein